MRLGNASANQRVTTRTALEREVCLTGVMTEARAGRRSDLDTGESGDGRSDAPMDVAMGMATTATPVTAETAGAITVEPM
jgi:hypothetical protein